MRSDGLVAHAGYRVVRCQPEVLFWIELILFWCFGASDVGKTPILLNDTQILLGFTRLVFAFCRGPADGRSVSG